MRKVATPLSKMLGNFMLDYVNANIFHVSFKSREAIKSEKTMDNMSIWQLLVSEQDIFHDDKYRE